MSKDKTLRMNKISQIVDMFRYTEKDCTQNPIDIKYFYILK